MAYNIRCLSLDQVNGFDWCTPTFMTVLRRNITHAHLAVDFPEGTNLNNPVLYDEDNVIIGTDRTLPIAKATMEATPNLPSAAGDHNVRLQQKNPLIYLIEGEHRVQASLVTLLVSFTVTTEKVSLSFQSYSNAGTKIPITQAAVATFAVGDGHHVDLVLSTEADGRIAIGCVTNSTKPE